MRHLFAFRWEDTPPGDFFGRDGPPYKCNCRSGKGKREYGRRKTKLLRRNMGARRIERNMGGTNIVIFFFPYFCPSSSCYSKQHCPDPAGDDNREFAFSRLVRLTVVCRIMEFGDDPFELLVFQSSPVEAKQDSNDPPEMVNWHEFVDRHDRRTGDSVGRIAGCRVASHAIGLRRRRLPPARRPVRPRWPAALTRPTSTRPSAPG